jgi:hypothetical protein
MKQKAKHHFTILLIRASPFKHDFPIVVCLKTNLIKFHFILFVFAERKYFYETDERAKARSGGEQTTQ